MRKTFIRFDGSECYETAKRRIRKVGKNQKVKVVQPGDVQGASGMLKFPTVLELFRDPFPSLQAIWDANHKIDKYTPLSQDETEDIKFDDLSKIVKDYENYKRGRAITVERDHIVEIQMVGLAWERAMANNEKVRNTRATSTFIRVSVNHLENLNCTLGAVNMKKGSAVRKFLSDCENTKGLRPNLWKYGVLPNTTDCICKTYEVAAGKIVDKAKEGGRKIYDDFADEITLMIDNMKLAEVAPS